ncbi:hypothetical protein NA78x_004591 [Anatilimnocola sp. NA78]|uniref:hypothetical protein n=1 Tax=Anatilimnocola sp. NA78 TaxID=3415683 RepID=UPI003CE4EF8F
MTKIQTSRPLQVTIRGLLLLTLLVATGLAVWKAVNRDDPAEAVRRALTRKYLPKETQRVGELQFPAGTKLTELDLPALRKANPDLHVFKTSLDTGHVMCYPEVQVAVASKHHFGRLQTAEYLSPDYASSTADFGEAFCGLRAEKPADRQQLAEAISTIFRSISGDDARLAEVKFDGKVYRAMLWKRGLVGQLVVLFDQSGAITHVALGRPSGG